MASLVKLISWLFSSIVLITSLGSSTGAPVAYRYNVVNFGAKPDGKTDSTGPFLKAWQSACRSPEATTVYVPKGRYLLRAIVFRGPCNKKVTFLIDGTLWAPTDFRALGNSGYWILFSHVNNLAVYGGNLDAKGAGFWACRRSGKSCPVGASVRIHHIYYIRGFCIYLDLKHCK